jgi:hypothetical protein
MRLIAALALALAASAGVGEGGTNPVSGSSWEKRLDTTTCDDFRDLMTSDERLDAADALLVILRAATSPDTREPDDDLVVGFAHDIARTCDTHYTGRESIVAAATLVYLGRDGEPSRYVPPHRE